MNALLPGLLAAANNQQGGLASLLPLVVLVVGVGYIMMAPQRKQRKQQAEMLSKLQVGDEVLTGGGILGFVTFLEDDVAHVQVDTDVVIRVTKTSLTRRSSSTPDESDDESGDTVDVTEKPKTKAAAATDAEPAAGWRARAKGKATKPSES